MAIGTPSVFCVGTNTNAATTTQNVVSGDLLVAAIILASVSAQTVTGLNDGTNFYSRGKQVLMGAANTCEFWYCLNAKPVASGATLALSTTGSPGSSYIAAQVSGIANVDTVGGPNSTTGTSQTPSVTSSTLAIANEIVFGIVGAATTTGIQSEGAGFSNLSTTTCSANSGGTINLAYKIVASTNAVTYAPTLNSSQNWADIVDAFQGLSGDLPFGTQSW